MYAFCAYTYIIRKNKLFWGSGLKLDEQVNNQEKSQGFSKRVIALIAIVFVILLGSAAAYFALNGSVKNKYFSAEKATLDFIGDELTDRFEPELTWQEYTQKNAIASNFELSGEYQDLYSDSGLDPFSPEQILNNSSLTIKTEQDIKNKKVSAEFIANIAGMKIDDIRLYLTDKQIMFGLPFLDDILLIKNEDIDKLAKEIDPELDSLNIDLADLFDSKNQIISEEDIEYFKKEYLTMIHDELSDDAFTSKDEKVDVNGETIKAEKITMHLSEKEVKDLLVKVFDKIKKDEKIKEIIKEQLSTTAMIDQDMKEIFNEYENALEDAKHEIQDLYIPDGLSSTIWIDKKLIVKRELTFTVGSSENDYATLSINGEQLLEKKNQTFTYDFSFKDSYNEEGKLTFTGDLSWKDDKIKDTIKFLIDDIELAYTADETVKKGERDFNRVISYSDSYDNGSLIWSGKSNYNKDKMNSEHNISLDIDDLGGEFLTLNINIDGKKIKDVNIPKEENVKNIGEMTQAELYDYFEQDVAIQLQQWMMQIIGGGALGF